MHDVTLHGHKENPFSFQGYHGTRVAGFAMGGREDGFIFEAQGAYANQAFKRTRQREFNGNVPRLDAQNTISKTCHGLFDARGVFDAQRSRNESQEVKRQRNLALITKAKAADTCYVGSRSSGAYLCVYNAGSQHPERYSPGDIRYECRYSNDTARNAYADFCAGTSISQTAAQLVRGHLERLSIHQPWFTQEPPLVPMSGYTPSDRQRKLQWFKRYVQSTLLELLKSGDPQEVAEALGVQYLWPRDGLWTEEALSELRERIALYPSAGSYPDWTYIPDVER